MQHPKKVSNPIFRVHVLYLTEKVNHLKVNRARLRKALRKVYLKINHKVHARFLRKARARPAQGLRKVRARSAQGPRKTHPRPARGLPWPRPRPVLKKTSVSQMIALVMTIQTVQESSKSELSLRFLSTSKFGPPRKTSAQGHARLFAQGQGWFIFSIHYCT